MKPLLYKLHEYSTDLEQIGENLALEYSSNKKFDKFYVLGNSYQETREGYNSLNIEDVRRGDNCTIDNKTDTSFRVTVTDNTQEALIFIKANLLQGNHTVQMNRISQTSNLTSALQLYTSSLTWIKEILPNEKSKATFNISSSEASVDDTYYIRVWLKVNNSTEDIQSVILSNLMIYEGTDDKPYEQHGETPSEKYPSKIKSCGDNGNINFKETNKNMFYLNSDSFNQQGLNVSYLKNVININGIASQNTDFIKKKGNESNYWRNFLGKFPSGKYCFSIEVSGTASNSNNNFFALKLKNETAKCYIRNFSKSANVEFTLEEDTELYLQGYVYLNTEFENYTAKLQIELNNKATDIIEPQEQTITVPVQQPFRSVRNVIRDKFIFKTGKWYEQHWIKRTVFDGTMNKFVSKSGTTNNNLFAGGSDINILKPENDSIRVEHLCNYFTDKYSAGQLYFNSLVGTGIQNGGFISFAFGLDSEINTLEKANNWLKEKNDAGTPLYVDYILSIPEEIECNEEQNRILSNLEELHGYKGTTNIYSEDEVSPVFEVEYSKDLETILKNN